MENADQITSLHRRRGFQIGRFTTLSKRLDEYEQASQPNKAYLTAYTTLLDDTWKQYRLLQEELEDLGEEDDARVSELTSTYYDLVVRIHTLMVDTPASSSKSPSCESSNVAEPTSIKLPEIHVPIFDGTVENWHSFYDSFLSIIDRNERLTPVEKFHYLQSSLTGKAAQSIQSLDITELNYSIAIDILKEKFDCHRQVCMRHWDLIFDYPKITKETPEAIDDFLEMVKVNLQALKKLGEPVTSNVVLLKLFTLKVPSAIIRKWHRTLPDKKMPSYTHLTTLLGTEPQKTDSLTSLPSEPLQHDLLVTAQVNILNNKIQPFRCRALLDTGSSMNFITEKLANSLKLNQRKCSVPIGTLNTLSTTSKRYITATITSIDGTYERTLTFLIIPTISSWIPDQPIDRSTIRIPRNLQLADPRFHIPAPIEILLSAGPTLASLDVTDCVGQLDISQANGPDLRLQKTQFGWVIGGSPTSQSPAHAFHASTTALKADLARFWEIDEGPPTVHISEVERQCEEHFRNHVQRNNEGRYIVALPFNETTPSLGSSKAMAMKRLTSLCRRFQRDKQFEADYHAVIQEYLELGHMTTITTDHRTDDGYLLPHHGVIKKSSQTTKLRVVFDGSAPTTTGVSLNNVLHTGPKLQDDIFFILLRFRSHQYVITGDVEKMYRQFLVRPEDRKFQQILWRNSDGRVDTYQLNTVTFGLSAAPYLAIRCLKQLADDEGHRYPRAATVLQRDFYVDDVLTGVDTKGEARSLRTELTELLKLAGLNIRKWAPNDRELLRGLSEQDINDKLLLGESQTFKTLGVVWNSFDDSILYSVKINSTASRITKRTISSEIAKIYDPLGLLAPVIVRAKMLLQRLWTLKIDWDESLPAVLHTEWNTYYAQLPLLNNVRFPRKTIIKAAAEIELHGFCDASERRYGACIYLRTITPDGHVWTQLLTAKSKVAPLKSQTIPNKSETNGTRAITTYEKAPSSFSEKITFHRYTGPWAV
ncbi:uncharacterized protein [Bombus flavifrons]|uniref:uncharacterized protein n=1 Tax=Bombus flavifrons TaxID=103934 RepID=UPI00370431AE